MSTEQSPEEPQVVAGATEDGRVFVVTPNAMAVEGPPRDFADGTVETGEVDDGDTGPVRSVTDMVEQPAKVMRIGNMIRQLLDEVKAAPLDDASRQRLRTIHQASISELGLCLQVYESSAT